MSKKFETEIEKRIRYVKGRVVDTIACDFYSCNILEAEAGTNGLQGGDTGHGCRTYIRLQDAGSTDMTVHTYRDKYGSEGVEIILGGDTELQTIVGALKFIAKTLENGMEQG